MSNDGLQSGVMMRARAVPVESLEQRNTKSLVPRMRQSHMTPIRQMKETSVTLNVWLSSQGTSGGPRNNHPKILPATLLIRTKTTQGWRKHFDAVG